MSLQPLIRLRGMTMTMSAIPTPQSRKPVQFPQHFPTLSGAARFLNRLAPEQLSTLKVHLHDGSERTARNIIRQWAFIQQNLDQHVSREWTERATVDVVAQVEAQQQAA
jgi:hypothetical protein